MKYWLLILSIFTVSLQSLPKRDARGNLTENYFHLQSKANLKLDKMEYSWTEHPILKFKITNHGDEAIRMYPSQIPHTSFQLMIQDSEGFSVSKKDLLAPIDPKQDNRNTVLDLTGEDRKEVILHPGESYVKSIPLKDYFHLKPGEEYKITGYFYPDYIDNKNSFLKTSNLALFKIQEDQSKPVITKFPESNLSMEGLSPQETIYLFLAAESKKNWSNHFKYIHFPEYITSYDRFRDDYLNAEAIRRDQIIDEFKNYLTQRRSGVLKYFKIQSVQNKSSQTTAVTVYAEREQGRIPSKYEYIYILKKGDFNIPGFWKITSVTARVKR